MANTDSTFTYENTLNGFADRITTTLGDDESGHANTTYDRDYIKSLICDAFIMLSRVETDLFPVEEVEFTPTSGQCIQRLPDECEEFLEWFRVVDGNGRKVPVMEGDYDTIKNTQFFPQPCYSCKGDVMSTVATYQAGFSPNSDRVYAMNPMVPEGTEISVIVLCRNINRAVGDGDQELPQKIRSHAMMLQFLVLTLITSKDDPVASQAHFQSFLGLANLSLQQQAFMRRSILENERQ